MNERKSDRPNQITAPNCRQALRYQCAGFFGRVIRRWRPFPVAVGEFRRSAALTAVRSSVGSEYEGQSHCRARRGWVLRRAVPIAEKLLVARQDARRGI